MTTTYFLLRCVVVVLQQTSKKGRAGAEKMCKQRKFAYDEWPVYLSVRARAKFLFGLWPVHIRLTQHKIICFSLLFSSCWFFFFCTLRLCCKFLTRSRRILAKCHTPYHEFIVLCTWLQRTEKRQIRTKKNTHAVRPNRRMTTNLYSLNCTFSFLAIFSFFRLRFGSTQTCIHTQTFTNQIWIAQQKRQIYWFTAK